MQAVSLPSLLKILGTPPNSARARELSPESGVTFEQVFPQGNPCETESRHVIFLVYSLLERKRSIERFR